MSDENPPESLVPEIPMVWQGKLEAIYISSGHDYWGRRGEGRLQAGIRLMDQVECVAGMGLRGDRYFGYRKDFKGQVTFLDQAVVDAIRLEFKLPQLPASVFRRNLIISGIDLSSGLEGLFEFQGIVFEGVQECKPCHWMDRVIEPGAEAFMKMNFRGGLRAKVITDGVLHVGEPNPLGMDHCDPS